MEDKLKEIFLKVFPNDEFDLNKDRSQFENWDSLAHLQLTSDIESSFNIKFEMDDIVDIQKPKDLLDLIEKKKNDNN